MKAARVKLPIGVTVADLVKVAAMTDSEVHFKRLDREGPADWLPIRRGCGSAFSSGKVAGFRGRITGVYDPNPYRRDPHESAWESGWSVGERVAREWLARERRNERARARRKR